MREELCITPSTEYSSEVCYDSMFDLRVCDKYYISEEPSLFQRFRLFCKRFSESSKISYFIMSVIVVNTLCMAVEHHKQVISCYNSIHLTLIMLYYFQVANTLVFSTG